MTMLWRRTWTADPRAAAMADRHYSRQTIGAAQFSPPGKRVVLVLPTYRALWVSQTPVAGIGRADGYEYWNVTIFRNESSRLATVLIRQAIEATLHEWRHLPTPRDGLMTFIDERKVQSPPGDMPYGWTFLAVGFDAIGRTKERDFLRLQLSRERLAAFTPRPAPAIGGGIQRGLFEEAV